MDICNVNEKIICGNDFRYCGGHVCVLCTHIIPSLRFHAFYMTKKLSKGFVYMIVWTLCTSLTSIIYCYIVPMHECVFMKLIFLSCKHHMILLMHMWSPVGVYDSILVLNSTMFD